MRMLKTVAYFYALPQAIGIRTSEMPKPCHQPAARKDDAYHRKTFHHFRVGVWSRETFCHRAVIAQNFAAGAGIRIRALKLTEKLKTRALEKGTVQLLWVCSVLIAIITNYNRHALNTSHQRVKFHKHSARHVAL